MATLQPESWSSGSRLKWGRCGTCRPRRTRTSQGEDFRRRRRALPWRGKRECRSRMKSQVTRLGLQKSMLRGKGGSPRPNSWCCRLDTSRPRLPGTALAPRVRPSTSRKVPWLVGKGGSCSPAICQPWRAMDVSLKGLHSFQTKAPINPPPRSI
jgi:hypothetical protein